MTYNPTLVARLKYGISQGVARHILSHDARRQPPVGWRLDTVIRAVAGDVGGALRRQYRRRVREDAQGLAALGIEIVGDRVRRVTRTPEHVTQTPKPVTQTPGA